VLLLPFLSFSLWICAFFTLYFCSVFLALAFRLVSRFYFSPPQSLCFFLCSSPSDPLYSGFSSPFYRETCPSTSPAFAGLLFKLRTGSWARDVVHDLLQISCWISFIRANVGDNEQCFQNDAVVSSGMAVFNLVPKQFKLNNWDPNQKQLISNCALRLNSIESLNYNTVYKTVLNFRIVQFSL